MYCNCMQRTFDKAWESYSYGPASPPVQCITAEVASCNNSLLVTVRWYHLARILPTIIYYNIPDYLLLHAETAPESFCSASWLHSGRSRLMKKAAPLPCTKAYG